MATYDHADVDLKKNENYFLKDIHVVNGADVVDFVLLFVFGSA
jgi:hypothetical protein